MSWPYDAAVVQRDLRQRGAHGTARSVGAGKRIVDAVTGVPYRSMGRGVLNLGQKLGGPSGPVVSAVGRGVAGVGRAAVRNPVLTGALALGAVGAPILSRKAHESQQKREVELMNAYRDPERPMEAIASLRRVLEKSAMIGGAIPSMSEAAFLGSMRNASMEPGFLRAAGGTIRTQGVHSLASGIGAGIGAAAVSGAMQAVGAAYGSIRDAAINDPRRRRMLDSLMRSDTVISDAVARNPQGEAMLRESYGTMVRFAPSLSLDPNATRSFLREAVLGGAGVNYATIKNLVETERAVMQRKERGR